MNKKLTVDCTLNICNSIIQEQNHKFWTSLFAQTTTTILVYDTLLLSSPIHSLHYQSTHRIQPNNTIPSFPPIHNTPLLFSRNYSFSHYITLPSTLNQFTVIKFDFNTSPPKQCSIFSKYNHSLYPHSKNVITNQQLFSTSKSHDKPIDLSSHIHTRFLNHKSILFIVLATRIGSFLSRFYHYLYFLFI